MPRRFADRAHRALLTGALSFCAVWALASLWFPFGWDQGLLASVGDVILAGGMPYRDAWDIKGPLAHLWFAAAQWLFGRGQAGIRILDLALLIAAAIALARAGSAITRTAIAPWIAMALVLCHSSLTFFYTAQPDGAVSMLLAVAFAPLLTTPRWRHLVFAGFAIGLAALVKPFYLIFLPLPIFMSAAGMSSVSLPQRWRTIALIAVAAAVPIVLTVSWFVARGAFSDLVDVLIRYNAVEYSGANQLAIRTRLAGYGRYLWTGARAPAIPFLVFGALVLWERRRTAAIFIVGWFVAALAVVGLQGKFYPYQWTVIFPPAILLVAAGIDALRHPEPGVAGRQRQALAVLGYAAVIAIAGSLTVQPTIDIMNWSRFMAGVDDRAQYYSRFRLGDFSAADQIAAADYLKAHTAASDKVAILGYEAPILYLSGRTNQTRFAYALPLVGWQSSQAARNRYRREFMSALQNPPEYIVVGILLLGGDRSIEVFPEFADLLKRDYRLDQSFGVVDLYRRVH